MDSLDNLLGRFEAEYLDINDISTERRIAQVALLRRFALSLDHPIMEMTPADLRAFIGGLVRNGLNPTTGRKYMGMLRSFIGWAYDAGLIDTHRRNELLLVGNPRGGNWKHRPNPYKPEEIVRFYAVLRDRFPLLPKTGRGSQMLRTFRRRRHQDLHGRLLRHAWRLQFEAQIALALEAGLRRVEIHGISIAALHPENTDIVVLTAKQRPGGQRVQRAIPYTEHAQYWVGQWLNFRHALGVGHDSPWLTLDLYGSHGRQLTQESLTRMSHSFPQVLGTADYRWHRFRHTAATEWLRAGVPLEKVRVFMGHTSLEQTLAYAELLKSDISDSFEKAQPLFNERLGLRIPVDEEAA